MDISRRNFLWGLGTTVGSGALISAGVPKKLIEKMDGDAALIRIASNEEVEALTKDTTRYRTATRDYVFPIPEEGVEIHASRRTGMWQLSVQRWNP